MGLATSGMEELDDELIYRRGGTRNQREWSARRDHIVTSGCAWDSTINLHYPGEFIFA